ncbi:excinuclease ABC subunit UvrA [bacterium]|nr:excinuclease ABC subunit UvrA [bacterium]MBU1984279.1 excinuclease ABC subunit UvrA [bacterium]
MELPHIRITGAREHNLKNIDVLLPRNSLIVITGISGSGKSSLAFDTLYAEGQRRYVESLSAYARQFLGLMEKPDVDSIEGLSPAISIQQKAGVRNPRSTVATVTEIYDYLRLLYARIGKPHCPQCGKPIQRQSAQEIVDALLNLPNDTKVELLSPLVIGRKGEYRELLENIRKDGFVRVRVDGTVRSLDDNISIDKKRRHTIEVVVDRLVIKPGLRSRLTDSVETALRLSSGLLTAVLDGSKERVFSERFACPDCNVSISEIEPRLFSFNSPFGACPLCSGLGFKLEIDPDRIVPNPDLSVEEGALATLGGVFDTWTGTILEAAAKHFKFRLDTPWKKLKPEHRKIVLYGSGQLKVDVVYESATMRHEHRTRWEGVIPNLMRRYRQTASAHIREWIEEFMSNIPCPECGGTRLRPEARAILIDNRNIAQTTDLSIQSALDFFGGLQLSERDTLVAHQILKEIRERLSFLLNVGLDYLTLNRAAGTLSGGEAQRIRLATQIGSQLTGVLYILDEPSIGLHQRDNDRLIHTLTKLRDIGNTVVVVEHDRDTILAADWVVDLGPGAGVHGGELVAAGPAEKVMAEPKSVTGQFLSGADTIPVPNQRRAGNEQTLTIKRARGNNLKDITVDVPLEMFTVVTGVSGSGKSTLVNETLYRGLAKKLYSAKEPPLPHGGINGTGNIDKVIDIDQSPIGRTPRSNPATYTGLFSPIRDLFCQLPEAKIRGYKPGRFSFNVKGGRCENCEGDGIIKIEMHFLPDVYVPCEICHGKRYNKETLEVRFKGRSISDVLDMTVSEANEFFDAIPAISRKLATLEEVGLGYIHLGQQATTLSGGEAQRVKLATELSRTATGQTLYILDEPTTGLHFADIKMLLKVLHALVDRGNTVVVIEHNMDVIKTADYVIDLGPEGGDAGGYVIATGTPEEVARVKSSYTGQYLARVLAETSAASPNGRTPPDKNKQSVSSSTSTTQRRTKVRT